MSKQTETRGKIKPRPAQHRAICSVCNHPQIQDIERRYLDFEPCANLAADFGVSDDSISRHGHYFGLDERRAGNTEKVLRAIIGKGLRQLKTVPPSLLADSIKELNRITGKHKEPAKNPNDLEEAKRILEDLRRTHGKDSTFEESQKLSDWQIFKFAIKPYFPEIRPEQLEIENFPDLEL